MPLPFVKDLGHGAVLRRGEKRGVSAHQEYGRHHQPRPDGAFTPVKDVETEQSDQGDADLGQLPDHEGPALAEAVREVAGDGAEDRPRRVEQDRHQRDGLGLVEDLGADGVEHRRRVDELIVEARQELGDDQADEGAVFQRIGGLMGHRRASVRASWAVLL
jgi:hypothetical protein